MSRPSTSPLATDAAAPAPRRLSVVPGRGDSHVATLRFALPRASHVMAYVIDSTGQTVHTLCEATLEPGEHLCSWDGCDDAGRRFPAGTYTLRLEAAKRVLCVRVVTLR